MSDTMNDVKFHKVAIVGAGAVRTGDAIALSHRSDWSGAPPVLPLAEDPARRAAIPPILRRKPRSRAAASGSMRP